MQVTTWIYWIVCLHTDPAWNPGATEWAKHQRPSTSRGIYYLLVRDCICFTIRYKYRRYKVVWGEWCMLLQMQYSFVTVLMLIIIDDDTPPHTPASSAPSVSQSSCLWRSRYSALSAHRFLCLQCSFFNPICTTFWYVPAPMCKLIGFTMYRVKWSKFKVTSHRNHCRSGFLHSRECWLLLVVFHAVMRCCWFLRRRAFNL